MQLTRDAVGDRWRTPGLRCELDFERQRAHRTVGRDRRPILADFGELSDDGLNRGGIHVCSANGDHVVCASQDPAFQMSEGASAAARPLAKHDDVASAIADDGAGGAAEIRDDQFSWLAVGDRRARVVQHLADVLTLVEMQETW